MFIQRALITFTLGPLALFLVYLGGWFYFLPVVAILVLATIEYVQLTRKMGWRTHARVLVPIVVGQYVVAQFPAWNLNEPALLVGIMIVTVYALWLYEQRTSQTTLIDWLAMIGGVILLGWLGGHFFRLRLVPEMAWQWTMLAMLSTWISDSGGYVFGKRLGKHKLAPRLSPNKTVEGYVGGLVTGVVFAALISFWLGLPIVAGTILGLLISVLGTAGDLSISLLKREAGVKDSGNLLPGHGGALDRTDSLLWAVALTYYFVTLFVV
ncbi:MAG: phosphatidate cytidylyltransferase [Chloroflexi bacterium]|nr:phosphatidate cytidylyltransferase [Chloroflexota bacterium]